MKLEQLLEAKYHRQREPISIETDSGRATLNPDDSMELDNSGYLQTLTPDTVHQVWNGAEEVNHGQDTVFMDQSREWKNMWYIGEEMHTIPDPEDFGL